MSVSNIILYRTDDGQAAVSLYARDGSVWMNQTQLAELFATSVQNISLHIINIFKDNELSRDSVFKEHLNTAADGKDYSVGFYSLEMILAIGYRVRSPRGTQFRQWATRNLKEFLVKGFLMDDERLKNPDGRPDYFDEIIPLKDDLQRDFYAPKVRSIVAQVRHREELQILHLSAPKVQAIVAQGIALGFIRHPYQSPERAA